MVVAAVQGHAIGAGFQLALAADIRVVADDVKFAMKEIALGLVPDLGGTATLVHTVGYGRALEICATGRTVGAAEAVSLGIASMAVPTDELDSATSDLVSALLAVPSAPLRVLKPLMRQALTATPDEQLVHERTAQGQLLHGLAPVSYTHLRAHETVLDLVCRLLLEKKITTHTQIIDTDSSTR